MESLRVGDDHEASRGEGGTERALENSVPETNDDPPSEDEDEHKKPFEPILSKLDKDAITRVALQARRVHAVSTATKDDYECEPIDFDKALYGGWHVLIPIHFTDATQWLLKIPVWASSGAENAHGLESEARTMQLLKARTSIPLPEVYAYSGRIGQRIVRAVHPDGIHARPSALRRMVQQGHLSGGQT
ncbi:hypothetical protein MRB53_040942 [Persea americana]|nr:hypothetical protein MRB53_040942 [Persea americana]